MELKKQIQNCIVLQCIYRYFGHPSPFFKGEGELNFNYLLRKGKSKKFKKGGGSTYGATEEE